MIIPEQLVAICREVPERRAWLAKLPAHVQELQKRWSLSLGSPWSREASCSWVAPAVAKSGARVVLKLGMPHLEATHEIDGLRFWNGEPTVRLLEFDRDLNAMLLERCEPGSSLRELPEAEQDVVIAELLRRLWRRPEPPHSFSPLATMIDFWVKESLAAESDWPDAGLVRAGLELMQELGGERDGDVLLATDLHAGNVLRAQREPWLVIDPKPFVGDRAYDATQHLRNCKARMLADPRGTIARVAELLGLDGERIRWWMFTRAAAEPRADWTEDSLALARSLG